MTDPAFLVPVRVPGGPKEPQPKPPPAVGIRLHDGTWFDVTEHARTLWDLLPFAVQYGYLEPDELDAALALGVLAKFPVAHIMRYQEQEREYLAAERQRKQEARERAEMLAEEVSVTAAHPFPHPNAPGGRAKPSRPVKVTLGEAIHLHDAGVITRPNVVTERGLRPRQ